MRPDGGAGRWPGTRRAMARLGLALVVWLAAGPWVAAAQAGGAPGPAARAAAPAAGLDTLGVEAVLERHRARLDSLLLPESTRFDTAGVASVTDSLDRGGVEALRSHSRQQLRGQVQALRFGLEPLAMTTYNRIEGLRLGSGLEAYLLARARVDLGAAYGFSNHRWSGRAGVTLGKQGGPALQLDWADLAEPFASSQPQRSLGLLALVAGQDREDYLRRRRLEISLWTWRQEHRSLGLRLFERRESSVAATTDFRFLGGASPIDAPNPRIDAGRIRGATVSGHLGSPAGRLAIAAEAGVTGGALGGDFDYSWQSGRVTGRRIFPDGGVVSLVVEGMNVGGAPPVQALGYLGGDGNLRGYDRLEFVGRRRASARLEYALGSDLLARARIPFLEKLHLQFVPFADAGTTWGECRGVDRSRGTLAGALRGSFGLGVQRLLWLPGLEAVRLDLSHRADGRGHGPSLWFRVIGLGSL